MRNLLKFLELDDNAINIYLGCLGKVPLTFVEINSLFPNKNADKIRNGLDNLIENDLLYKIEPKYAYFIDRFFFVPPFPAFKKLIKKFKLDISESSSSELETNKAQIEEAFIDKLSSLEKEYNELLNKMSFKDTSGEVLSEFEQNFKKLFQVLFNNNIKLIASLSEQPEICSDDFEVVLKILNEKLSESNGIITQMFTQIDEILDDMYVQSIFKQKKSFNSFVSKVKDSFNNSISDLSKIDEPKPLIDFEPYEKSINNIISDFSSKYKPEISNVWLIESREAIKEEIKLLLDRTKKHLTIIVPDIDKFVPLDYLKLDYSLDLSDLHSKNPKEKLDKKPQILLKKSKKHKMEKKIEEAFDLTAKKVSELKGYELSHEVANLISLISEINPKSFALRNMKDWLNRLLTIRKHLDKNIQILLLEDINCWKTDYLKFEDEGKDEKTDKNGSKEGLEDLEASKNETGLKIKIISSEPHKNLHVLAFNKKPNIEYKRIKNNNIICIKSDKSYFLLGDYQIIKKRPYYTINGFGTNLAPLIEILNPIILGLDRKAKPRKEIQLNDGFNQIIQNINTYKGLEMGELLEYLLDIAFKKTGISLNVLELKLLVSKLKGLSDLLNNELKTEVIENIYSLNSQLTNLPLKTPPELEDMVQRVEEKFIDSKPKELIEVNYEDIEIEKVENLFEIFLDQIDNLNAKEISVEIEKFIEVLMNIQGLSKIVDWKNKLKTNKKEIDSQLIEDIKNDFNYWKSFTLTPLTMRSDSSTKPIQIKSTKPIGREEYPDLNEEEGYISPGLSQSQFDSHREVSSQDKSIEDSQNILNQELLKIYNEFESFKGTEISRKLQNIVDIILETKGYSTGLKEIKDWVSKLKREKSLLEGNIKEQFILDFVKWKENYYVDPNELEITLEVPSKVLSLEKDIEIDAASSESTFLPRFDSILSKVHSATGKVLGKELQLINDDVVAKYGAVSSREIRSWVSKLRAIIKPLDQDIIEQLEVKIQEWKEKFK